MMQERIGYRLAYSPVCAGNKRDLAFDVAAYLHFDLVEQWLTGDAIGPPAIIYCLINIPFQHIDLHFAQKIFHSGYAELSRLYRISNRFIS